MPSTEGENVGKDHDSHEHYSVLEEGMSGGPMGLGDPNDKRLRKIEKRVVIPQKMKERAKVEFCAKEVKDFADCARGKLLSLPFKCREPNTALKKCLEAAYTDQAFIDDCTREYIEERSFYRLTGIRKKVKKAIGMM